MNSGPGVAANLRTTMPLGVDAVAEALVREIEERHQPARADGREDLVPLRRRRIDAGGVVAARVQHDDRAAAPSHSSDARIAAKSRPCVAAS